MPQQPGETVSIRTAWKQMVDQTSSENIMPADPTPAVGSNIFLKDVQYWKLRPKLTTSISLFILCSSELISLKNFHESSKRVSHVQREFQLLRNLPSHQPPWRNEYMLMPALEHVLGGVEDRGFTWNDAPYVLSSDELRTSIVLQIVDGRPTLLKHLLEVWSRSVVGHTTWKSQPFQCLKWVEVFSSILQLLYSPFA